MQHTLALTDAITDTTGVSLGMLISAVGIALSVLGGMWKFWKLVEARLEKQDGQLDTLTSEVQAILNNPSVTVAAVSEHNLRMLIANPLLIMPDIRNPGHFLEVKAPTVAARGTGGQ